jgi:hypothetical protein
MYHDNVLSFEGMNQTEKFTFTLYGFVSDSNGNRPESVIPFFFLTAGSTVLSVVGNRHALISDWRMPTKANKARTEPRRQIMSKKSSMHAKGVARYISFKTVDGELIRGKIFVEDGKWISDVFLKGESSFIAVWGVNSQGKQDKVLVVNKRHIVWVEPEDVESGDDL